MSMLAERKRKQKFSLNPRGKIWSEDSNKFGQKLLEKMGWSKGKGLGAKEDGRTEHIRVSYKHDSKGMGYKDTEEWTQHEENFSSLLASLSQAVEETEKPEVKVTSLEEKSKSSRARVHYKKFTRGKDVSRYSDKDLANVFGKKTLKPPKVEVKCEEIKQEETDEQRFGVETTNRGSMADYFKRKMKNFALQTKNDSESETEGTFGFGFKAEEVEKPEKKKGKKRKHEGDLDNGEENHVKSENDSTEVEKKRQKKKKKSKKDL